MRFINLASSSDGNATYITDDCVNILIDVGINYKEIKNRLKKYNISPSDIDIIFVTHAHYDHIRGLKDFIKENHDAIVIGNEDSLYDISKILVPDGDEDKLKFYTKNFFIIPYNFKKNIYDIINKNYKNNNFIVNAYESYHDKKCTYYIFEINKIKIGILTDCGHYDDSIVNTLKDINYLMLESNYDIDKIDNSKYPDYIKNRIKGPLGHLSNDDAADIIIKILHDKLYKICLSHISHNSNDEENALKNVVNILKKNNIKYKSEIIYARRDMPVVIA